MSFNSIGADQQPLLPPDLEDGLKRIVGRAGGALVLALVALVALSLVSWSVLDPSLTHATSGTVSNWMGATGAVVSDLLLQMLGLAAALAILAPMFWGGDLIANERVENFRTKAAFFPLSLLLLAGASSALQAGENWPLHHGLGGILGDAMFGMGSGLFGLINPANAGLATGLLFLTAGLTAAAHSIGFELRQVLALIRRPNPYGALRSGQRWQEGLRSEAHRLHDQLFRQSRHEPEATAHDTREEHFWPAGEPRERLEPVLEAVPSNAGSPFQPVERQPRHPAFVSQTPAARPAPWGEASHSFAPVPPPPVQPPPVAPVAAPPGHDDAFDDPFESTDSSRAIARRFAPASVQGLPPQSNPAPVMPAQYADAGVPPPPQQLAPPPYVPEQGFQEHIAPAAPAPLRRPLPSLMRGLSFGSATPQYKRPSLNMLKRRPGPKGAAELSQAALRGTARLLEDVLGDFGVKGEIRDIRPGPVVTLYELEPQRGTKSSRVIGLAEDIARSMGAASARVAVVPGRNALGIELPNMRREVVQLRDIFEADAFRKSAATLPITLGKSISGEPVVADLARMPHLLVAGTTGSGKSVGVNAMILSLLYRHAPDDCRLLMIDPKMLELSVYNGIPHLLAPVVTDPHKAVHALNWAVGEMEERYKRMAKLSVRNIDVFNNRVRNAKKHGSAMSRTVQTGYDGTTGQARYEVEKLDLEPMPYIVIVVDEFADLMIAAGKEIEQAVQRLAQKARAAGIHLIMATQRPSVDIITGTIKANFPTRISFKVASKIDSRTIINEQGAEQLLGQGDMLFSSGSGQPARVHGPFVSDEEVESVAQALRAQGEAKYVEGLLEGPESTDDDPSASGASSGDGLYDRAVAIAERDQKASVSYLQRRLSIGYNRAADLIERMEHEGLIGPANAVGKRDILTATRKSG